MAKLSKEIRIVLPGDVYPTTLPKGAEVEGRVAEVAEQLGALDDVRSSRAAPRNKASKSAPETK